MRTPPKKTLKEICTLLSASQYMYLEKQKKKKMKKKKNV